MKLTNSRETYGFVAQAMHWLVAILIISLFPMGKIMHDLPSSTPAEIADKTFLYSLHQSVGITVFCLAVLRILWALMNRHPYALNHARKFESFLASVVHWMLYFGIIATPLSGWLHHAASKSSPPVFLPFGDRLPFVPQSETVANFFGEIHEVLPVVLIISILLHLVGTLKHLVIDRDDTLKRMIPCWYKEGSNPPPAQLPSTRRPLLAAIALYLFILIAASFNAAFEAGEGHHDHDHDHQSESST